MKLNREQIIKALECCLASEDDFDLTCRKCPIFNSDIEGCMKDEQFLLKTALSLIKELAEENERLRASSVDYRNIPEIKAKERADTVRKMQERLKYSLCCIPQCHFNYTEVEFHIDRIAKEMLEGV